MENKDNSLIYIGLAFLAGATIVYLLLKNRQPIINPPTTKIDLSYFEERLSRLEAQISKTPQIQAAEPVQNQTEYKNNEKYIIKRGSDGRIAELNIVRDAKVDNN